MWVVPIESWLVAGPRVIPVDLGTRETFADLAATILENFGLETIEYFDPARGSQRRIALPTPNHIFIQRMGLRRSACVRGKEAFGDVMHFTEPVYEITA